MKIIIDIGANNGFTTKRFLKDKDAFVYSFEPLPNRYQELKKLEIQYKNFKALNFAACNEDGKKQFYINSPDVTSSLKPFTNEKETWEVKEVKKIEVLTTKLSTFIKNNDLEKEIIHLIKIDTQGSDFDVILSLDEFLKNVNQIQFECFLTDNQESLYENECKCMTVYQYLKNKGFEFLKSEIHHSKKWADVTMFNKNLKK